MTSLSVLPARDEDLPFLHAMLVEAVCWRPGSPVLPLQEVLADPSLAVYLEQWGRPGDQGLVARVGDQRAGAVWARRFDEHRHGYGYLDPDTPELTLAVAAPFRRRGIARCLLAAMIAQQRLDGSPRLSLSVEDDNPACALYEQFGFATHTAELGSRTMTLLLRASGGDETAGIDGRQGR